MLGLVVVFEGTSWWAALQHFKAVKGKNGCYEAFRDGKDPPSFVGLFEDSASRSGIVIAAPGLVTGLVAARL